MSSYTFVCEGADDIPHIQLRIATLHCGVLKPAKKKRASVDEDGRANMKCDFPGCRLSAIMNAETTLTIGEFLDTHQALCVPRKNPAKFGNHEDEYPGVKLSTLNSILIRMPKVRKGQS